MINCPICKLLNAIQRRKWRLAGERITKMINDPSREEWNKAFAIGKEIEDRRKRTEDDK